MGVETASFISSLVASNPTTSDKKSEGDDHLRLLKGAVQGSFPSSSKAWYNPTSQAKTADFTVAATDMNCVFLVDTSLTSVIATLPTLVSGDKGWECSFIKTNVGLNALFIAPASGTLQSGDLSSLAKTRRCIPGAPSKAIWTGSSWFVTRAVDVPVGGILSFEGSSLPVGYEWPNGQVLAGSSGSVYPDYFARKAGLTTTNLCGRIEVTKDNLGGVTPAGLVTSAGSGIDGLTAGAVGGGQNVTLDTSMIPSHIHSITDPGHAHQVAFVQGSLGPGSVETVKPYPNAGSYVSATAATGITATNATGGSAAHNNMPPSIVMNKILVVE